MNEAANCGGPERLRMIERWPKMSMIFGAALILIGVISACFKIETELKYANVGSDYRWVRPIPTSTDDFILGIPEYRSYSQALHCK